jgi:hypothetical protein
MLRESYKCQSYQNKPEGRMTPSGKRLLLASNQLVMSSSRAHQAASRWLSSASTCWAATGITVPGPNTAAAPFAFRNS